MNEIQLEQELESILEIPTRDLNDILESIREGAQNPAAVLGFGPEALAAIEQMALGFYRAQLYDKAATLYGFVLQLNSSRASAWRGLGACSQAIKEPGIAVSCYQAAISFDPGDVVSRVFWGECLCALGLKDSGLMRLREAIDQGTSNPAYKPYLTRARAILAAGGGVPSNLILSRTGKALAAQAQEAKSAKGTDQNVLAQAVLDVGLEFDENREITCQDIQKDPRLAGLLGELSQAVEDGRLDYAVAGGFSNNELDGAYVCACQYAEMGDVLSAMQICGHLIFLDSQNARYYQLVGICLQRLKQYETADYYYRIGLALAPKDVTSLIYCGEANILAGKTQAGLELVKQGLAQAEGQSELKELYERGQVLLRRFGGQG